MLLLDTIDSLQLQKIHNGSFPLPNITQPEYIGGKTVIDHGCIIGFGIVKQTLEGILILDSKAPVLSRAAACKTLVESFKEDMKKLGYTECHAFVKDKHFKVIMHHLGFQDCLGGDPMVTYF